VFQQPLEYLEAELRRLDWLLHRQILRLRAAYQLSLDEFRGLYISDDHVDHLIRAQADVGASDVTVEELTRRSQVLRKENAEQVPATMPWRRLAARYGLDPFEQDVVLLAVAPELDLKYETLLAYLNNDVTRKYPTRDLALRLFCDNAGERAARRCQLQDEAILFREGCGLLQPFESPSGATWLAAGFRPLPGLADVLLGQRPHDSRLAGFVETLYPQPDDDGLPLPADVERQIESLVNCGPADCLVVLDGLDESAQRRAAERLCARLGIPLLLVDIVAARSAAPAGAVWGNWVLAQQRLTGAAVLLHGCEALLHADRSLLPDTQKLIDRFAAAGGPVLMSAASHKMRWTNLLQGHRRVLVRCDYPSAAHRRQLWHHCLARDDCHVDAESVEILAQRYVLTSGQIADAVSTAADAERLGVPAAAPLSLSSLARAVRAQSRGALEELAVVVQSPHGWDALVLPKSTDRQVKNIAAAMRNSHVVYGDWGFAERLTCGCGVKALFSGPPGTGKTMTAGVIARDLNLDLYVIELSQIVSKYIGDTERNLDRIFRAARNANAILFFDEADALFGKRSEVKDAHDRYANIEVAYLLQKVESHEGHVILASNLKKNIDEAFSRRLHYVVEFPRPDAEHRERLWRGMIPGQAPLSADVDFPFLAQQFDLTGGDIQNIVLDAAFLAAENGQALTMEMMIQAVSRQMIKKGKIPAPADFKQYRPVSMPT
jgi:hypothetical protein